MASIFCDGQVVFMIDYLERGRTINGVLLLQDNAPAHTPQVAMIAATESGFEILLIPHILLNSPVAGSTVKHLTTSL